MYLKAKMFQNLATMTFKSCQKEIAIQIQEQVMKNELIKKEEKISKENVTKTSKEEDIQKADKLENINTEDRIYEHKQSKIEDNNTIGLKKKESNIEKEEKNEKEALLENKFDENHKLLKLEFILKMLQHLSVTFGEAFIVNKAKEDEVILFSFFQ